MSVLILVHSSCAFTPTCPQCSFYATGRGRESVREWLKSLPPAARKMIGENINTVQFGRRWACLWYGKWMPNCGKCVARLKRVLPACCSSRRGRLWCFCTASSRNPARRQKTIWHWPCTERRRFVMAKRNAHIGSSLDDVLHEDGVLEESSARAIKRVIAWQLQEAMKTQGITKAAMARRMHTSRSMIPTPD